MENIEQFEPVLLGDDLSRYRQAMQGDNGDAQTNDELIFGRFKTMDEALQGFRQAEAAAAKAKDFERQLQAYKDRAQALEEDAAARDKGFTDRIEMALKEEVRQKELDDYLLAGSHLLHPRRYLALSKLINHCRGKCTRDDLNKIRRFFSPEVIALVSEDAALYKHVKQFEYENMREQEKAVRFNRQIEEFKKASGGWADSEFNNGLISQAVELSDGRVDLAELKKVIEQIEADAVKKYQTDASIQKENAAVQDQLYAAGGSKTRPGGKKWLTREEYYKLTPEQEAEKYDQIVEQIKLENKGLLPRMLTK